MLKQQHLKKALPDRLESLLKGLARVTVNKLVFSEFYVASYMLYMFFTDFSGLVESTMQLLPKIHQYLCIRTTYECSIFPSKIQDHIVKITHSFCTK